MTRAVIAAAIMLSIACSETKPPPTTVVVQAPPQPAAPAAPAAAAMPIGPAAPGQYTNHIGNPQTGHWDQQGQWQWNDPKSKEASSTLGYLAAAGAGAAGGAALAYLYTKKNFEKQNPTGWSEQSQQKTVSTYLDKRGQPISEAEYRRRREQSDRDRERYHERQKAKLADERKQLQQEKDRLKQRERDTTPTPAKQEPLRNVQGEQQKRLKINRWKKRRR